MKENNLLKEEFYTTEEVALMLKLHVRTVQKWLEQGKLKGVRIGRIWRIPESALKEFLRQQ